MFYSIGVISTILNAIIFSSLILLRKRKYIHLKQVVPNGLASWSCSSPVHLYHDLWVLCWNPHPCCSFILLVAIPKSCWLWELLVVQQEAHRIKRILPKMQGSSHHLWTLLPSSGFLQLPASFLAISAAISHPFFQSNTSQSPLF